MSKVIAGPNVMCYLNGGFFGNVASLHWSASTPGEPIEAIDSPLAYEVAPRRGGCTGILVIYRLKGDGGAEGVGLNAPIAQLQRGKYFSLVLIERTTDTVLFRADRCHCDSQNWGVQARALVQGQIAFTALEYSNEVR